MPQQRGFPTDPRTNVAAFTRAQVLPKQIAQSLRPIFAQWTDLDSQLYLYDTDTQHPGRSATAHYRVVYDRGLRLARFVGRWTKVAAATIKLRALLHFPHAFLRSNDQNILKLPTEVRDHIPYDVDHVMVVRVDYDWTEWDVTDLGNQGRHRLTKTWLQLAPTDFDVAHWFVLWLTAPAPDEDEVPELIPKLISGPTAQLEPGEHFEPPVLAEDDPRQVKQELRTPSRRGRTQECDSSSRSRSAPAVKPPPTCTPRSQRQLHGQTADDSDEEGEWVEDDETQSPTKEWYKAPSETNTYSPPPAIPDLSQKRVSQPPNRWPEKPGDARKYLGGNRPVGWNHRGQGTYHHNDVPDSYASLDLPPACLYGVSTLVLPFANEFPGHNCHMVEQFYFDFPDSDETYPTETQSLASFEGLLETARTDPPAEDQSDTVVHGVLLATYLTQCYVTMRELRATEVSAKTAIGKDWDESRNKEVDAWQNFGAGKVVKKKDYPYTKVLKTRWVYTIKPDGRKKSRLCVRGDIEKRQLGKIGALPSHESWAPSREADRMYYAITAEMKWATKSSDYPNAFLQSDEDKLEREILLDLPEEARKHLNMKYDEVYMLSKNAYGTIDAPRAWQRTLQQEYTKQEFVIHPTIPTLFMLYDQNGRLEGHSKVHMDDSEYAGGSKRFQDKMSSIQKRFKVPDNKIDVHNYTLCGRQVRQCPRTMEIKISLEPYAEMIERIQTKRGRDPDSPLEPWEVTEVQRVIGQAIWYCSNAAPHASFRTSMLASMRAQGRYACILSANELVDYIHKHKAWYLHFKQVAGGKLDNLRVVAQHDASKSTVDKRDWTLPLEQMRLRGYAGRVFMLVDEERLCHQSCPANLVHYRASKPDRVCTAPSSVETLAGVKCKASRLQGT